VAVLSLVEHAFATGTTTSSELQSVLLYEGEACPKLLHRSAPPAGEFSRDSREEDGVPGALCGLLPAHCTYHFPADDASTSTGHIGSLGLYSDCVGVEAHHVAEARGKLEASWLHACST
jgi:hypothetical protein